MTISPSASGLLVSAAGLACFLPAQANWSLLQPAVSPPARGEAAIAYDSQRAVTVLFSGRDTQVFNDTWEWNGTVWSNRQPATSPPPRRSASMAYDPLRGVVLMFGGIPNTSCTNVMLGDTWEWNGSNWTQRFPANAPTGRHNPAMCFFPGNGRIVMFGGGDGRGNPVCHQIPLDETWEWDGSNWIQATTPTRPSPRFGAGFAYEQSAQRCILFGGFAGPGAGTFNDTWAWNGATWQPVVPLTSPPTRGGHTMVYDTVRDRLVVFGGSTGFVAQNNDTWEWTGADWARRFPANNPPARIWATMAYDEARGETLLFGGRNASLGGIQATWTYSSSTNAGFATYGSGCGAPVAVPSLSMSPFELPWIGAVTTATFGPVDANSLPYMLLGFGSTSFNLGVFGLAGCTMLVTGDLGPAVMQGTTAIWSATIPNVPIFVGATFFLQGVALSAGGGNPLGAVLSSGAAATIGLR